MLLDGSQHEPSFRRLTQSSLTLEADGGSSYFWWFMLSSSGDREWLRWNIGDITSWLHSDDQVNIGLRNNNYAKQFQS